jgi:hypothetical protein
VTAVRGQFHLWSGVLSAKQRFDYRRPQMSRQHSSLIETAMVSATPVQGHRDNSIGAFEHVDAAPAHQRCERARQ